MTNPATGTTLVDLGETRSYAVREAAHVPGEPDEPADHLGVVGIKLQRTRRSQVEGDLYHVTGIPLDRYTLPAGKAFAFRKAGGSNDGHVVFLADDRRYCNCDCAGFTYEASRRAERRDGTAYPTLGCKHLDAAAALDETGVLRYPLDRPADADPRAACVLCAGCQCVPDGEGGLTGCPECDPEATPALAAA